MPTSWFLEALRLRRNSDKPWRAGSQIGRVGNMVLSAGPPRTIHFCVLPTTCPQPTIRLAPTLPLLVQQPHDAPLWRELILSRTKRGHNVPL